MSREDKAEFITNAALIVCVLGLIGTFVAYWIWPTEISRFIYSLVQH